MYVVSLKHLAIFFFKTAVDVKFIVAIVISTDINRVQHEERHNVGHFVRDLISVAGTTNIRQERPKNSTSNRYGCFLASVYTSYETLTGLCVTGNLVLKSNGAN